MTTDEFNKIALDYLKGCKTKFRLPNRAGLCVALNWKRQQYFEARKEGDFMDIIARFEQACEDFWVQRLGSAASQGAIFYLKNAFKEDWSEESTIKFVLPTPILGSLHLQEDKKNDEHLKLHS